jgi:CRP/FNR family nitrogen fixation transcriptional regulator
MKAMLDDRREGLQVPAPGPVVRSPRLDDTGAARTATGEREFHFTPRSLIFLEGQEAKYVFQVITGVVMLYKLLPDGRRQVVEVLGEGDVFGFSPAPVRNCTAEALSAAKCRTFERGAIDRSPALFNRLSGHLCSQLAALHEHTVLLGRKTAMERIASFLMRCVPGRGGYGCPGPRPGDDGARFRLIMTRQEIADYLGLTIETVSRSLTKLRTADVLTISNLDEISIHNVCRLCRLTGTHLTHGTWCSSRFQPSNGETGPL